MLFTAPAETLTSPKPRAQRNKRSARPLILAGGGVLAAVAIVGVLAMLFGGGAGQEAKKQTKASSQSTIILDWPESERASATLSLDTKNVNVPPQGPIELKVKPGKHVVGILRRSFEPIRGEITVGKADTATYTPQFKELLNQVAANATKPAAPAQDSASPFQIGNAIVIPGFEGWQQLLPVAKEKAAADNKDLLLVFGSSDGNTDTGRLATALKEAGLPGGKLGERFVPVVIDFPETGSGANRVVDTYQNRNLKYDYNIRKLPVLALADAQGRPYAVQREWTSGVREAADVVETLSAKRTERDLLLAATERGDESQRFEAAIAFIRWLMSQKMLVQYRAQIHDWWQMAQSQDPQNAAGKQEVMLEAEVLCQLRELPEGTGRVEVVRRLDVLDPWTRDRKFSDDDRGFRLHFIAANILGPLGEESAAIAHLERAALYDPKDADLKEAKRAIAGRSTNILSSGTGFVVAQGGYILTNKHVVEGAGRVAVRVPGVKEPVAANKVIEHDSLDIALVQVDFPPSFTPQPTSLSLDKLNRGKEVAAFGYPQGDDLGQDLKFTKGSISALPNASLDNMILLDLRVNPGNSGGPLCDIQGNVVGMITAKTGGYNLDSYGMAIPAEELDKFLSATLAEGVQRATAKSTKGDGSWANVDEAISPAVLMIVKVR
jgi:S1-C subfamily serine protease